MRSVRCEDTAMNYKTSSSIVMHYDEFGAPDAPPVLLVHGSTLTGTQDYCVHSDLAARLAKRYRVIVPDCRGHGRSSAVWRDGSASLAGAPPGWQDTRLTYSFSAMAQDCAELLQTLNASPACVIGHSNGGNVALYMAKEQPQHVRAAVLLAANAYIDQHLRDRVPVGMNPDRVAHESAEWMNEMIALHDPHHGDGYWRELLKATINETITNPEWTARDLQDVRVPCLCVQGENDGVNAPGRHAQTLADWLPVSELWIPPGVGHSVHYDLPDEFERRVCAFFDGHRA